MPRVVNGWYQTRPQREVGLLKMNFVGRILFAEQPLKSNIDNRVVNHQIIDVVGSSLQWIVSEFAIYSFILSLLHNSVYIHTLILWTVVFMGVLSRHRM